MLADAIQRGTGRQPILPDSLAIIIDEAHKLPEAAHQMFGVTLRAEDIQGFIHDLRWEKYLLAADTRDTVMLCATVADLTAQFQSTLWNQPRAKGTVLSRPDGNMSGQSRPIILTSGTLAVGSNFHRFREEAGLLVDSRVTESVSLSPFDGRENCLLYVPRFPPGQRDEAYYDKLADEISLLLDVATP